MPDSFSALPLAPGRTSGKVGWKREGLMKSLFFSRARELCGLSVAIVLAANWLPGSEASAADVSIKDALPAPYYDSAEDLLTRKYLLGDFGRTALAQQGVSLFGDLTNETVANTSGGAKTGGANAGQFAFGTKIGMDRLAGLDGGLFGVTFVDRWGRNLNADDGIPALQLTNEVFGRGNVLRLVEFYYSQKLSGDALEVKGGRLPVGADFFFGNCDFLNLTFCGGQPGNILGSYIYNFPVSQMAGLVKLNLPSNFQLEAGVYDSNSNYLETRPSVALLPVFAPSAPNTGVLVPVELNWKGSIGGLAGVWKAGGWYDSQKAEQATAAAGIPGAAPDFRNGEYGGYVSVFQQLVSAGSFKDAPDPKRGLFTFFNLSIGDHRTSVQDYQAAWGVQKVGTFPSRPEDQIGFAIGTTHINSSIASAEAAAIARLGVQRNEYPLEAWYCWQATPWLKLRFDLQYVINPGGYENGNDLVNANGNALVLGLRTAVAF
jgi:porin